MTATNHSLTGMLIATQISNPLLLIPAAFVSHFVSDALPHWGEPEYAKKQFRYKLIRNAWVDLAVAILLLAFLAQFFSPTRLLLGAALAVLPDAFWALREFTGYEGPHWLARFHKKIQWGEFREGFYLEVVYAVIQFTFLYSIIR